jgi:pimeloyl-ACP methyl ester carboxylesterase
LDGSGSGMRRDQLPYGPADTWAGVEQAALHLREQLREQARREPGRAVDLVGHSMGGVVITYYLLHLHDAYDRTLPPVSHVVTIASPLEGSDLARAGGAILAHPAAGGLVRWGWESATASGGSLGHAVSGLHPDAPAIEELATGSALLIDLERAWQEALRTGSAGPLAMGTRILAIAGSLDAVVGADRAALPGVDERRVLPGGHEGVLASEAVREVTWRFLADEEVVASPGYLATGTSALYGAGLTLLSAGLGDAAALGDLGSDLSRWHLPG